MIEGGKRAAEGRCRVALDKDKVGILRCQVAIQGSHGAGRETGKGLIRLHEIQVGIGTDIEHLKDMVKHLPVLGGDAHAALKDWIRAESKNYRGHLDSLRARPEDDRDFLH
jgi:hypothetical protein